MNKKIILALAVLSLTSIFCAIPGMGNPTSAPDVGSIVRATLTAVAAQAPTATPTLSTVPISNFPSSGFISGTLGYPADAMPPMRVVAWNTADNSYEYIDTQAGQTAYQIELPVGTYTVVAYSIGGGGFPSGVAGGYTQDVLCGLTVSCTDHTLIPVTVTASETVPNINPTDFYAPDGTFPPKPGP
jgi:hypothetical protein